MPKQQIFPVAKTNSGNHDILATVASYRPADHQQLQQWNNQPLVRVNKCVHHLIAQKCRNQGEKLAIDAWDGKMTYAELDQYSFVLAARLAKLGVGPEVMVPVCFEKSRWVLVAIMGVIKAGGAFVLLDESQTTTRMQYVCREVNASIIVTSQRFAVHFKGLIDTVVAVDYDSLTSTLSDKEWTAPDVSPRNALYVLFTSGSTGQPKGVIVEHASFSTCCLTFNPRLQLDDSCRVFQFSSYTWDVSIEELLATLIAGGCVCIPSNEERMSNLTGAFNALEANWLDLVPTVARSLNPDELPRLKALSLGGEAMSKSDIVKWAGRVHLVNAYGPTECTVTATLRKVSPTSLDPQNIGHAGASLTWIVDPDDHSELMPVGSIGELLIEGPIVARGYLNRPDLTATAFIEPPAWRHDFSLGTEVFPFYKTGDLCQYMPDGTLRFVGRKDDSQVKVHGQRLELVEVEHHVKEYFPHATHIRAIFVSRDINTANTINGLIVLIDSLEGEINRVPLASGSDFAAPTDNFQKLVRAAVIGLRENVPGYMVPSHFLPLCQMPLMPSGKGDIRRLKEQVISLLPEQVEQYVGGQTKVTKRLPTTAIENELQRIWANVLGITQDKIGVDADFFALGGSSLAAMQLVILARRNGFHGLTVSRIFRTPTLSGQAEEVSKSTDQVDTTKVILPPTESSYTVSDLAPGALGSVQTDQISSISPTSDFQRTYLTPGLKSYDLWRISQPFDQTRLIQALQLLVNRHSILRTIFVPHQDGFLQVALSHLEIQVETHPVSQDDMAAFCRSFCQKDSEDALPAGAPYFQATLVSSNASNHVIILRTTHAQHDMDALSRIFKDLVELYHGRCLGPVSADFHTYMQYRLAKKTDAAFGFWRQYLHGAYMTTFTGMESNDSKRSMIAAFGSTPHPPALQGLSVATLVKAAWALTLARVTKQTSLVFGHTTNVRDIGIAELEQTVGCCLNTVPLRVTIESSWTARQLLEHLQHRYVQTMEHEMLELSDIVRECTPWKAGTDFGSVVTHDHEHILPVTGLDGSSAGLEPVYPELQEGVTKSMLWPVQVVTHSEESQLGMGIMAFNDLLSQSRAEWLIVKLGEAVTELASAHSSAAIDFAPYDDCPL